MEGHDSVGRRVSLLNDTPQAQKQVQAETQLQPQPRFIRLPSITPSLRSRASSYNSSPVGSPPTPFLVRSNSSDSTVSMQSQSPTTPNFYDGYVPREMPSPGSYAPAYFAHQIPKDFDPAYPSAGSQIAGPMSYPYQQPQPTFSQTQQQILEMQPSAQAPAAPGIRQKKSNYPCPLAKEYQCNDHFTTSGHAARHAKKHTGEKLAVCPECSKRFTRKDNMEQHRRTHQNGRNAVKGNDNAVKKAKPQAKRPKPSPLQSSIPSMSTSDLAENLLDPALAGSQVDAGYITPQISSVDPFLEQFDPSPYPDTASYTMSSYGIHNAHSQHNAHSPLHGLRALANVAGEKRKYGA